MSEQHPAPTCPHCHSPVKAGARFCPKCGNALSDPPAPPRLADAGQLAPTQPSLPAQPSTQPPRPRPAAAPPPPAAPPADAPSTLADAVDSAGAALSHTLQSVAGKVRRLLSAGEGDQAAPPGAQPGDYVLGVKPVSGKDSNVGSVRQVNEDSLIAFEFTRVQESRGVPLGFYVVADGMGGHKAGEIASRTVNKIVTEKVLNAEVIPGLAAATRKLDETPASVLPAAVQEANRILHSAARRQGSDMGTTLTAALIVGETATIANVGDSRTYLYRDGALRQLTQDHSLVASLVAAGMIQPSEVRQHPQRNQVYRTLGVQPQVEVDMFTETLQRGDRLLLCSDGLWEEVEDPDIARILAKTRGPQQACQALIRRAISAGGSDNITVIVVNME